MINLFFNVNALRWCVYVTSLGITKVFTDYTLALMWAEGFATSSGLNIHYQDLPK